MSVYEREEQEQEQEQEQNKYRTNESESNMNVDGSATASVIKEFNKMGRSGAFGCKFVAWNLCVWV